MSDYFTSQPKPASRRTLSHRLKSALPSKTNVYLINRIRNERPRWDSNPRCASTTDLQSAPFVHSGTRPTDGHSRKTWCKRQITTKQSSPAAVRELIHAHDIITSASSCHDVSCINPLVSRKNHVCTSDFHTALTRFTRPVAADMLN